MMEFQNILTMKRIYNPSEILLMLEDAKLNCRPTSINDKVHYFNIPCAFDIETTSFRTCGKDGEEVKAACMYVWTFGVGGLVCLGRTWKDFVYVLEQTSKYLDCTQSNRLVCYVHNLEYDFQFFRKHLEFTKLFAISNRKPLYALTDTGVEFRCSYLLSGYNLEYVGKNLNKYKVEKKVGDLDYRVLRHSETPLTDTEKEYCVNDVKVVMAYIQERIESDGSVAQIPLTKTGYVRKYCRDKCFNGDGANPYQKYNYLKILRKCTLDMKEYAQLKRAFQGGFVHANMFEVKKVNYDVTSYDFTSSYPAVMVSEKYPMCACERVKIKSENDKRFIDSLSDYNCLWDAEFINIRPKIPFESYISSSRCIKKYTEKATINNGRIVKADRIITTITEQDYLIIKKCYKWDKMNIYNFKRYEKSYLPREFIGAILKLYEDKTQLKGVEGKEVEYLKSKEMLNSCYGMAVTDIVREIYEYNTEWEEPKTPNLYVEILKYNSNKGRFMFYPWGVWVTAYARRNLWSGILEFGSDYIYSDTDSVKVKNAEKHIEYIEKYNKLIRKQLLRAVKTQGLSESSIDPKGKCLGVWDFDGHYKRFKTLGAKRYMVEYSYDERNKESDRGKITLTVSGLNKKTSIPYLLDEYGAEGIFDAFDDNLDIPSEHTGKLTHTYIDEPIKGELTDYTGISGIFEELSYIHLEPASYSLSLGKEYRDFLLNLHVEEF